MEAWLGKVEEAMFSSLRRLVKASLTDYMQREREDWVLRHAAQIILTVGQIIWCRDVTDILEGDGARITRMEEFERKCYQVGDVGM